jgi:hypothetical protein
MSVSSTSNVDPVPTDAEGTETENSGGIVVIESSTESNDGKLIGAAVVRAEERKRMADELKSKRIQRELAELESAATPRVDFDSLPMIAHSGDVCVRRDEGVDFDGMRQRYLRRREKKDVLRLGINESEKQLIVNWAELSKAERSK